MKGSALEKGEWGKDSLLLSVVGTAALLALLSLTMFLYRGSGPVIAEIPWFVPLVNTFLLAAAVSVAFLAFARFHVLRCPVSYWLGVASVVLGIGLVFYVLTWPGLTPGGRAIIGRLPSTSGWMATIAQTFLALFLLTAALARLPRKGVNGERWVWSVAAWILFAASIHVLLLVLENRLPVLVRPNGSYTPTFLALLWIAFILFAAGIVFSTRRYLLSRDALPAYIALGQAACAGAILMLIIGSKRYDLWWYLARVLTTGSYLIIMFGLLSEYVGLFRREREKSRGLRESEERFRALVEASSDVLYRMSPDWNEMRHLRSRDFLANTERPSRTWFQDYIHPDDQPHVRAVINESIQNRSIFELEHRVLRADGTLGWTFSRAVPLLDENGQIVEWFGAASDITERKRAEEALRESEERFRAFMDNSPTIAWAKDAEGRIVYLSRTYEKRFGSRLDDCRGKTDYELYPPEIADVLRKNDQAVMAAGHAIEFTEEKLDPDGSRCTWWNFKFPFQDASGRRYVGGVGVDITERKRVDEELRKARDELEMRVQKRTAELERRNQELQEFAFVASHDLSEPLRKIQTFGSLLEERSAGLLGEQEKDFISRMTGAANRMQELLNALLTYSRVDTKGQEFRLANLENVVRDAATDLEVAIRNVEAHVEIEPLPTVNGDPLQLSQLFQNLVANALKYHRPGVKPVIKVHGEIENGTGRIFVEDNGIGFDEKYLDKIFQPFQRLHGKNEYSGTGIGLAICRKIVERHGGTITARSTPGKGSTFIITLPVKRGE